MALLSGCAGSDLQDQGSLSFPMGKEIQLGKDVVTIHGIAECKADNEYIQPAAGTKFVVIEVTQEVNKGELTDYNTYNFTAVDNMSFTYEATIACKDPDLGFGSLHDGQKVRGYVTFEVLETNEVETIIFKPSIYSPDRIIFNAK